MLDVKKYTLLTFKGICMNFLLELIFFILSHPVTSKQPHKVVQIHMGHPVDTSLWVQVIFIEIKALFYLRERPLMMSDFRGGWGGLK